MNGSGCMKKISLKYFLEIQYVVLGPRLKVINLNNLPESVRNELKYSLKIAFLFLSIILKFQVPDINISLGIRNFDSPWSASQVGSAKKTQTCYSFHSKTWFSQYFMYFFSFLDAIKLKLFLSVDELFSVRSKIITKNSVCIRGIKKENL